MATPLGREQPAAASQHRPARRFAAVEIFADSGDRPLAAYQVELIAPPGVEIVGIEGGEHSAFAEPPYYDPAALMNDRVVLAALSTRGGNGLPRGKIRVATVHVMVPRDLEPEYQLRPLAAATVGGERIELRTSIEQGSTP